LLAAFVLVASTVELGWWSRLNGSVNDWAGSRRVDVLWNAAKIVFDLATPETVLPITLALGLLVAWRQHRWQTAGEAVVRVGLVVASVLLLKPLLAVPGPTRGAFGSHGGTFPSGHTTSTLVCMALILAWLGRPRGRTAAVAVVAIVVGVVSVTVIYLNYHYVSDVVGGVILGVLIATVPLPVLRRDRPQVHRPSETG
jgi:undecaprenyl-diphosphatase